MSKTIVEAIRNHGLPSDGNRVYRVSVNGNESFVVSNSPSQAALSVVAVSRVSDKDVSSALAAAIVNEPEVEAENDG